MNDSMTGSIVLVSALLPSNADTMSGNPPAPVSRPMVICGSSRRSFENPLSRNPSPASVSKYKVETSYSTRLAGPSRACAAHAARHLLPPGVLRNTRRRRVPRSGTGPSPRLLPPAPAALSSLLTGSMIRAATR